MKILCCQIEAQGVTTRSLMEKHQYRIASRIRNACSKQTVDLIFLPELSAIEYSISALNNLSDLATDLEGWLVRSMSELAAELDTTIGFGMPRRDANGMYISEVVIGNDGAVIGYYDKVHLAHLGASAEKPYFNPGEHAIVFEIADFRIGIVICYDMRFGDFISALVKEHELDLMLQPIAFTRDGTFASWQSFVCTRALENQIYWLSLNRAGSDWGHSIFCPPWIEQTSDILEFDESEHLEVVEVDKAKMHIARTNYPIRIDRLKSYGNIVELTQQL